ncbi:MAG: hypothetical protein QM613_03230 [Micrococcaceae bacterium]
MSTEQLSFLASHIVSSQNFPESNFSNNSLYKEINAGKMTKLHAGRYIAKDVYAQLNVYEKYLVKLLAVVTTLKDPIISHISAAYILNLSVPYYQNTMHFRVTHKKNSRNNLVKFHHYLQKCNTVTTSTIVHTDVIDTVLDCARECSYEIALCVADSACRKYKITKTQLQERFGSFKTCNATSRIQKIISNCTPKAESPGETLCRIALAKIGLTTLKMQYCVNVSGSKYRTDFYFPAANLIIEFDGNEKYYGKYGDAKKQIDHERDRDAKVIANGYNIVHLDWKTIHNPLDLLSKLVSYVPALSKTIITRQMALNC